MLSGDTRTRWILYCEQQETVTEESLEGTGGRSLDRQIRETFGPVALLSKPESLHHSTNRTHDLRDSTTSQSSCSGKM